MAVQRLSAWVALRCREPLFQRFLQVPDEAAAISSVRTRCGIASRRELDTDPAAAARFHQRIRLPFIAFSNHHQQEHEHV